MKKVYDVVVVGGGPGGFSAAAAAAREGASVALIEKHGYLGGMATAGLVNPFMRYECGGKNLASPVFNELIGRMKAERAIDDTGRFFDDEIMKIVLDGLLASRGVELFLHSLFTGVSSRDGLIEKIHTDGKSGRLSVPGKVFIDSTGDGDVAAAAGCVFEKGRDEDGLCQPMTLCFRIGGVSSAGKPAALAEVREELSGVYDRACESGRITRHRENVLVFKTLVPGVFHFNTTRITGKDGTDTRSLGEAEEEGRRQAYELFKLFREESGMFRDSCLLKMAAHVGVRETRRVLGGYVLTEEDVLSARKFEDGIARSNYPVDIHNPSGEGTVIKKIKDGDYYEVPFRCLVPAGSANLLVGSRCVSSTHAAHSSLRIMPVVSGLGEAAGAAGAGAASTGAPVSGIDGRKIKAALFGGG